MSCPVNRSHPQNQSPNARPSPPIPQTDQSPQTTHSTNSSKNASPPQPALRLPSMESIPLHRPANTITQHTHHSQSHKRLLMRNPLAGTLPQFSLPHHRHYTSSLSRTSLIPPRRSHPH